MRQNIFLFFVFISIAFFYSWNGLHIPYFFDDFQRVSLHPEQEVFRGFIAANAQDHFYRPIEQIGLALIQMIAGWDTLPIRIILLLLHAASALFVFHILMIWKISKWTSLSAALYFLISQLSGFAIYSNNTFSQISATLFSALSIWLLYRSFTASNSEFILGKYIASVAFFFLALISKETSSGLLLYVPFLIYILEAKRYNVRESVRKSCILFLPFVFCALLYWMLRMNAGASIPDFGMNSGYSFHFGTNIFRHIAVFTIEFFLPVSTTTVARAIYERSVPVLVATSLFTLVFASLFLWGLWKSKRRALILMLIVLAFCSLIPVIFLIHLSELYTYNMLFPLSLLFGVSLEYYMHQTLNKRRIVLLLFLTVGIFNLIALNEKAVCMKTEGERTLFILRQTIAAAKDLPPNKYLYLIRPDIPHFTYQRFYLPYFEQILSATPLIKYYSNRFDIGIMQGTLSECRKQAAEHPGIAMTCDPATFKIYQIDPDFTGKK